MKYALTSILIALTITNAIFVYLFYQELQKHVVVIDRHGLILSLMLETPEIKEAIDKRINSTTTDQN